MATTLLQARVGAGKTEAALKQLSAVISNPDKPFMKVWILLATRRQEVAFRQRLIDLQDGRGVYFNAEFFNFYDLNARLLNVAGKPPRRINEPARLGLMRQVLYSLRDDNQLPTFAPILRTSGFLRVVADLIYELKQNRVFPDTYLDAAQSQKDRELALIYARYQSLMQDYDLVDREGEGWLALEAIEKNAQLASDVDLLLVDGYDQFTPVQSALLAQLSARIENVLITLTAPPGDAQADDAPVVIGRRFIDARNNLKAIHETLNVPFTVDTIDDPLTDRHPDLVALAQNIFSDAPKVTVTDGFTMVEAPEAPEEVQAVWREIKRLLLSGIRPDDMLVAVRDWGRYYPHMERYTYDYDLPVLLHYGDPLANNPAIAVLMTVLTLAGDDPESPSAFRRRPLLDVLRSPYIAVPGMTDDMIDALDLISREKQVLGGRQNWLHAIHSAANESYDEETGEIEEPIIDETFGDDISMALEDFFDHITPEQSATHQAYVSRLEDLIGEDPVTDPDDHVEDLDIETVAIQPHGTYTLNIPTCIRNLPSTDHADRILRRDLAAMNQFKEILRGILTVQEFLRGVLRDSTKQLSWRDFLSDLQTGVKNDRPVQRHPGRSGRVLVTTATDARGLPHDHMFILGLSEGIFPADIPEDPLYLDTEREALNERGVTLQTQAERADDSGIFYELISQARQSLTLSRPHVRDGKQWVESHLWRMSKNVFADLPVQHIGIGALPDADTVATLAEAEITLAQRLSSNTRDESTRQLHQWIVDSATERWQRIDEGRRLETNRLSSANSYDATTGYIQHPDILEVIADTIDTDYTWSATRLSSYGACPYRFFANYLLKLSSLDELEEGMDVMQFGTLNHSILEKTYRAIRDESIVITPENRDEAIEILHEIATNVFENAPQELNFRPTALWANEQDVMLRQLEKLVELDFSPDAPLNKFIQSADGERRVYRLEQGFGFENNLVEIPLDDTGEHTIRVRGSIDRIDIVDDDRLVVVDYKSGTTGIAVSQMEEGKNFQMMVYLLVLHTLLQQENRPLRIAGGMFWHIRNQSTSGKMSFSDSVTENESIQIAQQHITNYIHNMREGDFRVHPTAPSGNKCTSYCEFYQLCRLANTNQHKKMPDQS